MLPLVCGLAMGDSEETQRANVFPGQVAQLRFTDIAGGVCKTDRDVLFANARSFITPDQRPALEQAFAFGMTAPGSGQPPPFMLIIGHTDQVGRAQPNLDLSLRRARAVVAVFLVDPAIWEANFQRESWNGPNLEIATMATTVDGNTNRVPEYVSDSAARLDLMRRYLLALRPGWLSPATARPNLVTTPRDGVLGCGLQHPVVNSPGTAVDVNRRAEFFFFNSATASVATCASYPRRRPSCGQFFAIRVELSDGCSNPFTGAFDITLPTGGTLTNQQTDSSGVWVRENSPGGVYTVRVGGWTRSQTLTVGSPVFRADVILPITRSGTNLCRNGRIFRFFGSNAYFLMESSATGSRQQEVSDFLRIMQGVGIKVVRTWAFNDDQAKPAATRTQVGGPRTSPSLGPGLNALDVVIDLAAQHNIYLILTLTNYWKDYGGIAQYARWAGYDVNGDPTAVPPIPPRTPDGHPDRVAEELFYTGSSSDPAAAGLPDPRAIYRNYVCTIINRFRNKPNILAWELMNEPRTRGASFATLTRWVFETGTHIRQQCNPPQLLSVGGVEINLVRNLYSDPNVRRVIDLVDTHLYPDDAGLNVTQARAAVQAAKTEADNAQRPFYLGEFGRDSPNAPTPPPVRSLTRAQEFEQWSTDLHGSGAAGMLFWQLLPPSRTPFDTRELNADLDPTTSGRLQNVPSSSPNPRAPRPTDGQRVVDFVNHALTGTSSWQACGNPNC